MNKAMTKPEIIAIHELRKCNTSYGNWALFVTLKLTEHRGTRQVDHSLSYWTKAEALRVKVGDKIDW